MDGARRKQAVQKLIQRITNEPVPEGTGQQNGNNHNTQFAREDGLKQSYFTSANIIIETASGGKELKNLVAIKRGNGLNLVRETSQEITEIREAIAPTAITT
jgi:hypothetical protein